MADNIPSPAMAEPNFTLSMEGQTARLTFACFADAERTYDTIEANPNFAAASPDLPPAAGVGVAWREKVEALSGKIISGSPGPLYSAGFYDGVEHAKKVLLQALSAASPPADHDASEGRGGSSAGVESAARGNPYPALPPITEQSGKGAP